MSAERLSELAAQKLKDPEFNRALNSLVPAIGTYAGFSLALMGFNAETGKRLHATPAGKRLLQYDPADQLGEHQCANVLGVSHSEFCRLVSMENFPAPDSLGGGTEFRDGADRPKLRSWSTNTVGRWLDAGCLSGRTGRPNRYIAERVGAVPAGG